MKQQGMAIWRNKGFRLTMIALLAIALVAGFVVERIHSTRAGEGEPIQSAQQSIQEEVLISGAPGEALAPVADESTPAPAAPEAPVTEETPVQEEAAAKQEAPATAEIPAQETAPVTEPETQEPAEQTPEAETAAPSETPAATDEMIIVQPEPTAEVAPQGEGDFANAAQDENFRTGVAFTLGGTPVFSDRKETHVLANLPEGAVVRVTKRIVEERKDETLIWLGVRFMAEDPDGEEGELIKVEGFVPAWIMKQLDEKAYLRRVELTEEDIALAEAEGRQIEAAIETYEEVPVVRVPYHPIPEKQDEEETPDETPDESEEVLAAEDETEENEMEEISMIDSETLDSRVEVSYDYEGDLQPGTLVTLTAHLYDIPEGESVEYQWKNNATGVFQPVPGANGETFTFQVDAMSIEWKWIVEVKIGSDA